jgi:hypothetical protein
LLKAFLVQRINRNNALLINLITINLLSRRFYPLISPLIPSRIHLNIPKYPSGKQTSNSKSSQLQLLPSNSSFFLTSSLKLLKITMRSSNSSNLSFHDNELERIQQKKEQPEQPASARAMREGYGPSVTSGCLDPPDPTSIESQAVQSILGDWEMREKGK